jgi:hypothetical protein
LSGGEFGLAPQELIQSSGEGVEKGRPEVVHLTNPFGFRACSPEFLAEPLVPQGLLASGVLLAFLLPIAGVERVELVLLEELVDILLALFVGILRRGGVLWEGLWLL